MTTSLITAVTPGTPSSPNRGRSCQSGSAIGPTSVDQFEDWYKLGRHGRYERSQMIASARGRPIPNDPPIINPIAKSKPSPARNSCHDMPLLPPGGSPRINIICARCVDHSRPDVVLRLAQRLQHEVSVLLSPMGRDGWRG